MTRLPFLIWEKVFWEKNKQRKIKIINRRVG